MQNLLKGHSFRVTQIEWSENRPSYKVAKKTPIGLEDLKELDGLTCRLEESRTTGEQFLSASFHKDHGVVNGYRRFSWYKLDEAMDMFPDLGTDLPMAYVLPYIKSASIVDYEKTQDSRYSSEKGSRIYVEWDIERIASDPNCKLRLVRRANIAPSVVYANETRTFESVEITDDLLALLA